MLINRASVSETLDAINAALFDGRTLAAIERGRTARWIAGRQGLPGAYAGTFAGFPSERSRGIVLFTGERIASASARHILGEEASRALRQLRVRDLKVTRALERADDGSMQCLARAAEDPRNGNPGSIAAASAAWASGGTSSQAVSIGTKSDCNAAPPICDRCATATSMAKIPFLVHGAGVERNGFHRSQKGIEVCSAGAGTRGDRCSPVSASMHDVDTSWPFER